MDCKFCKSDRILTVSGKCSDLTSFVYKDKSGYGYVPTNLPICKDGNEDYIYFDVCLDCGKIQDKFPVSESAVNKAFDKLIQG